MFTRTLKSVAIAAAVIITTAGVSLASNYATLKQNASVYKNHKLQSDIINTAWEGDTVAVADKWNDWYYIIVPGKDGWVRGKYLEFDQGYGSGFNFGYGNGYVGGSFCVNGKNAQFCLGASY